MWNARSIALGALSVIVASGSCVAAATGPVEWSNEQGAATSARLIDQCLSSTEARAVEPEARLACVGTAFDACTSENGGTMSEYDLNVCRRFSLEAWRARYNKLLAQFDDIFRRWGKEPADGWRRATADRFRKQEQQWKRWVVADCEMRELGSVGGSIHSYAVATCEERHIAYRTIDLTPLVEWWGGR